MPLKLYSNTRLARLRCHFCKASNGLVYSPRNQFVSRATISTSYTYSSQSKPRLPPSKSAAGTFSKARFTPSDIPPLAFFTSRCRPPLVAGLSPQDCHSTCSSYVSLALQDSPQWRLPLLQDPDKLYTLHYIACMIITSPPGPATHIGTHMLDTLCQLRYKPSILTLTRLALRAGRLGGPQFRVAEGPFRELVRKGEDADALALQGLITASSSDSPHSAAEAVVWLRRAMSQGGTAPGSWDYQSACALELGKCYQRQGKHKEAKEVLRYCAEQLDLAEGYYQYAAMLWADGEPVGEVERWAVKAAVSGDQDAARLMAEIQGMKAKEIGAAGERKRLEALRAEWEEIAGPKS